MPVPFPKGVDLRNQKAIQVADPTSPTDGANKQYVDNVANGRDWKESVRAASTANVTVASALTNGSSMDGVTLATGDRVLLKNQTTATENGIYVVVASGAASRATDASTSAQVNPGMTTTAEEGTVNGDKRFVLTTNAPITLGTTSLVFTVDAGGGTTYTASTGLTMVGSDIRVVPGNGIIADGTSTRVDPAIVVRKFAADCVATTNPQTFTHGLGTNDVEVAVWEAATGALTFPDITKGAGTVVIDWGSAPAAAAYRVVVQG